MGIFKPAQLTCLGNIVPVKRDWTVTKNVADPARKKNFSVLRHIAMRNRLYCMKKSVIAAFTRTLSMLIAMLKSNFNT